MRTLSSAQIARFGAAFFVIIGLARSAVAQEIPVIVNTVSSAKAMMLIDDSNSMECVLEHSNFSPTSAVATNAANTIPSVIFRYETGAVNPVAANTGYTLRPVLVEYNYLLNPVLRSPVTGNLFKTTTMANVSTMDLVTNMGCTTTSAYCNAPGDTNQWGIHNAQLFTNSSIKGASVFAVANLAKVNPTTFVTDTSGHEYLYMDYYSNAFYPLNYNWTTYWPKFDAAGNQLSYLTHIWATNGGTVKFNGKQVFLSAGLYRQEYLRWLFYGASATELANLPGTTRMEVVKQVMTHLIQNNPEVDFGISSLNGTRLYAGQYTGNLADQFFVPHGDSTVGTQPKVRAPIGTAGATLITSLNQIAAAGSTPLAHSYIETLRYFHGETRNDPYCVGCAQYVSPITSACDSNFVVLLTDGLPTSDSFNTAMGYPNINDADNDHADGATTNAGCSSAVCSNFLDDAAYLAHNYDFSTSVAGTQSITSYAVGLGLDFSLLQKFAIDGGSDGALRADTAEEISAALENIVSMIVTTPVSGAGAALAETFGDSGRVYRPRFRADTWNGNIDAFNYNETTKALDFAYDMGDILENRDLAADPRTMIVGNDPDGDGRTKLSLDFTVSNAGTLKPQIFRLFPATESPSLLNDLIADYTADASAQYVIEYIRGERVPGLRERDRDSDSKVEMLGDIVYSRPVEIGPKNGNYESFDGYSGFVSGLQSEPRVLLVGANDGGLHAFDTSNGHELWTYIPSQMVPQLEKLTREFYNRLYRRAYVDGPISVEDVFVNGHWRTFAMFGYRTGGTGYTVLDITDRNAPTLVYEVNDATSGGESWTKPRVVVYGGSGSNPDDYTWAMVVGTGENKATAGTNLLVYQLESASPPTPTVIALSATDAAGTRTSAVVPIQDDRDLNVDRLYVGTEAGNLYRVHISGAPGSWAVQKVYTGNTNQPIVATPTVVLVDNPQFTGASSGVASMRYADGIYFGTGRYDTRADITGVGTLAQRIVGIFDPVNTTADAYANVLTNQTTANFQNQSISTFTTRVDADGVYRVPTGKSGFYINMGTSINYTGGFIDPVGEIFFEPANVRGALLFSTFLPTQTDCGVGGHAFLEGMNFRTGGGFMVDNTTTPGKPFYNGGLKDYNNDGQINATDATFGAAHGNYEPALDAHVESVTTDAVTPYVHSGTLTSADIRLGTTGGQILPSVCSLGNLGAPVSPSVLYRAQQIVIQPAYPEPPEIGSPGSGSNGSNGSGGDSSADVPPPIMLPVDTYNLPIDILTFKEVSED